MQQQGALDRIDESVRAFILETVKDSQTTQELINEQFMETRSLVRSEAAASQSRQLRIDYRDRFLDSLRYTEMNQRRNNVDPTYHKTFDWIFDDDGVHDWDSFKEFLSGKPQRYWVWGKPGSGKSCLMKHILEHSRTQENIEVWCRTINVSAFNIVSHFIWAAGAPIQKTIKGLALSLVSQLLSDIEPDDQLLRQFLVQWPHLRAHRSFNDWSEQDILVVCKNCLQARDTAILILIDGLDELDPTENLAKTMSFLEDLCSSDMVKLCVSSRPEIALQKHLGALPQLKLEDLTRRDMELFAEQELRNAPVLDEFSRPSSDQIDDLVQLTVEKAEGVFLWIVYVVRVLHMGLLVGQDWDDLYRVLEELPRQMQDLYKRIWDKMEDDRRCMREDAAWYFRYCLDISPVDNAYGLLFMTLWKNPELCQILLNDSAVKDWNKLNSACSRNKSLSTYSCAGLLEFREARRIKVNDDMNRIDSFESSEIDTVSCKGEPLVVHRNMGYISLIHRSARDFLLGEGKSFLDESRLASRKVSKNYQAFQALLGVGVVFGFELKYGYLESLFRLLIQASHSVHPAPGSMLHSLIKTVEDVAPRGSSGEFSFISYEFSTKRSDRVTSLSGVDSEEPCELPLNHFLIPVESFSINPDATRTWERDLLGTLLRETGAQLADAVTDVLRNTRISEEYANYLWVNLFDGCRRIHQPSKSRFVGMPMSAFRLISFLYSVGASPALTISLRGQVPRRDRISLRESCEMLVQGAIEQSTAEKATAFRWLVEGIGTYVALENKNPDPSSFHDSCRGLNLDSRIVTQFWYKFRSGSRPECERGLKLEAMELAIETTLAEYLAAVETALSCHGVLQNLVPSLSLDNLPKKILWINYQWPLDIPPSRSIVPSREISKSILWKFDSVASSMQPPVPLWYFTRLTTEDLRFELPETIVNDLQVVWDQAMDVQDGACLTGDEANALLDEAFPPDVWTEERTKLLFKNRAWQINRSESAAQIKDTEMLPVEKVCAVTALGSELDALQVTSQPQTARVEQ